MPRMTCLLGGASLALALALTVGCGRSPTLSSPDASVQPDAWVPAGDSWVPPTDGWIPPPQDTRPPPLDGWQPPPPDGWQPPPPPDVGPPPPPFDAWPPPPPADGPCVATCQQKCQLLKSCGLIAGGVGLCASQQCPYWSSYQTGCLGSLVCLMAPAPNMCTMAQSCITTPPPPPLQPDLVVKDFKAVVSGATVTYTVEACNQGQGQSGNFFVDLYYDRQNAPTLQDFGDQYDNKSGGLAPGACVTTTFTRANTPSGTYTSWAQVDADGIVAESNESNNIAGPTTVVVVGPPPPPPGADLVIQNVQTQIYGYTSITVRYQIQICNNGSAMSGTTQVAVYYDRATAPPAGLAGDNSTGVAGLAPGACTNRNVYRTATPQGSYTSWAQVDPQNTVAESNESNNVFGPVKVAVGTTAGADLTIQGFSAQLFGTNTVRYQMQVCNVGTGVSGPNEVHVYFDQPGAPQAGDTGNQYTYVATLQPGACSTRNIYRSGTPAGTYTSWAQVDPKNAVAETNESNNVAGPITVVVGSTSSCSAVCAFAVSCGLFQPTQLPQCMTWCSVLTPTQLQCVSTATQNNDCNALKSCNTPPPPPPPPPPGVCPDLCSYLVNSCSILPSNQYWTCVGACENLDPQKIQCAQNAKSQGQCMQVILCMF